ncbi:hypothetical protein MG293_001535 [Ovis ammon polii]|uniref:Uncharacterized protein n=1 Tax=Ovis ammon polii TaxID=230172 RepID=A0AAD4YFQ4_OVIAM|nr:hypothetical protein MG293_001535 [Ovis ammon polii]
MDSGAWRDAVHGMARVGHNVVTKPPPLAHPYAMRMLSLSAVSDSVTPWTIAQQAPLSVDFSRQEYWSGLPFPIPGDPPDPGIEAESLASPALAVDSVPQIQLKQRLQHVKPRKGLLRFLDISWGLWKGK